MGRRHDSKKLIVCLKVFPYEIEGNTWGHVAHQRPLRQLPFLVNIKKLRLWCSRKVPRLLIKLVEFMLYMLICIRHFWIKEKQNYWNRIKDHCGPCALYIYFFFNLSVRRKNCSIQLALWSQTFWFICGTSKVRAFLSIIAVLGHNRNV